MSMYNMIHGYDPTSGLVLSILGVTPEQIPRYRDSYIDGERLVIYTRTGGGNRDYYENLESCSSNYPDYFVEGEDHPSGPWNDDLRDIPGFLYDSDDDYDCTYASFYYEIPDNFLYLKDKLMSMARNETQEERWEAAIDRIKNASQYDPLVLRMTEAFAPLFESLEKSLSEKSQGE